MSERDSVEAAELREDMGLVSHVGPLEVDWPRSLGYFGAIALAVAFEVIEAPVAIFIAAIPFIKLLKRPNSPKPVRFVSAVLEGAAKPVGGEAEATIRLAPPTRPRRAGARARSPRTPARSDQEE